MNVQFVPQVENVLCTENIIIDGQILGTVNTKIEDGPHKYHAAINFRTSHHFQSGYWSLIQGHGPSKETAVLAAIEDAKINISILQSNIDQFEAKLFKESTGCQS